MPRENEGRSVGGAPRISREKFVFTSKANHTVRSRGLTDDDIIGIGSVPIYDHFSATERELRNPHLAAVQCSACDVIRSCSVSVRRAGSSRTNHEIVIIVLIICIRSQIGNEAGNPATLKMRLVRRQIIDVQSPGGARSKSSSLTRATHPSRFDSVAVTDSSERESQLTQLIRRQGP